MHLIRVQTSTGPRLAISDAGRYVPVRALRADASDDLCAFLEHVNWHELLDMARNYQAWVYDEPVYLPPLSAHSRIFCVGKNYSDHAREMAPILSPTEKTKATPDNVPDIFLRLPSSFTGHKGTILIPEGGHQFDYEAELVAVIGKGGTNIPVAHAHEHIFGFTAGNDGTERHYQRRTSQFTMGKNGDKSGALGPAIVPTSTIGNIDNIRIQSWVDCHKRQDGNTGDMTFSLSEIIAFISQTIALQPGDMIFTGTPKGVGAGMTPSGFLKPGEMLRIKIDHLPELTVSVTSGAVATHNPQASDSD